MKVREGILAPGKAVNLDEMLIDQSGSNTHTFGRRSRADAERDPATASAEKVEENEDEATELDREGTFNPTHYQEYHRRDLVDP